MSVTEASPSTTESANVCAGIQNGHLVYNAVMTHCLHDSCMSAVDSDVWYF